MTQQPFIIVLMPMWRAMNQEDAHELMLAVIRRLNDEIHKDEPGTR